MQIIVDRKIWILGRSLKSPAARKIPRVSEALGSYEFYTYKRVGTSLTAHVDPFVVISDFEHSFIWHRNRQCRGPWACVLTRD
jgi:hypothetical protein